ncbi:MAG: hypothetical protein ACI94Y_000101 [Maribacter sp.]|jgi:hypothetical protein
MISGKSLQVFEDQVMFTDNPFQLEIGEEIVFSYFANGSTFRLDAEQSDGHPGNSNPSVVIEECGAGPIYRTDTAFTVVIRDEISPLFDITTINPGASVILIFSK